MLFCVEVMSERDQLKPPDRQLTLRRGKKLQKNIKKRTNRERNRREDVGKVKHRKRQVSVN